MRIIVLGCGVQGMLAAHAIARNGHEPVIISDDRPKSKVSPSQFLLREIPGITDEVHRLNLVIEKRGSQAGYAKRVYGSYNAESSWSEVGAGTHDIWLLKEAYDLLWAKYAGCISNEKINTAKIQELLCDYAVVISTIPAPPLCLADHHFDMIPVWILEVLGTERSSFAPLMIYNGDPDQPNQGANWSRYSSIRGHETWEYTHDIGGSRPGVRRGVKPTGNNCDCWDAAGERGDRPLQLRPVGRFARWERGVLMHHAFEDTVAILANEGLGGSAE